MTQFQYSIVYGLLNIETTERLSLGIIYLDDAKISVKYSQKKLGVLKSLLIQAVTVHCLKSLRQWVKTTV